MVNLIFHLIIFAVSVILMFLLKLIISAHSTKQNNKVAQAFKDSNVKQGNGVDSTMVKIDKSDEHDESELIEKLKSLYKYMNMSGFMDMMRFIFPQVFFLAFLFIRYYKKENGIMTLVVPLLIILCCLIMLSQLYLIGSFKLVGNRQYGEKAKMEALALKNQNEQDKKRMMEAVHNKEATKKKLKKKKRKLNKAAKLR